MLKIDGYDIYFRHKPDEVGYTSFQERMLTPFKGVTYCIFEKDGEAIVEGVAHCSVNDTFTKVTGRKVSLAHALTGFPKEFRTRVWEAYKKETSRLS